MRKLEDLAEVLVGQIMTRVTSKGDEGIPVSVLIPGAIQRGYIDDDSLGRNNLVKELNEKYFTAPGELVMKLTADYDVAIVNENQAGIAISSFVAVIRPKDIDNKYLCAVLNTEYIKAQLRSKAAGAIRPMLKVSDIRNLQIPVLDPDKQKDLGDIFVLSNEKIKLAHEMISAEKEITDAILINAIREECADE